MPGEFQSGDPDIREDDRGFFGKQHEARREIRIQVPAPHLRTNRRQLRHRTQRQE